MAGYPGPHLYLNRSLLKAVRASGRPGWHIALAAGFAHHSTFSALINSKTIPDSRLNRERLARVAAVVGFPVSQLFDRGVR
jgi:hypothetical protein